MNVAASNSVPVSSAIPHQVQTAPPVVLAPGMMLTEKYHLLEVLPIKSSEADYFLCTDKKQVFTAKIYKGALLSTPEGRLALNKIQSPNIAPILDTGSYSTRGFELLPYYKNASIVGKPLTADFIKKGLIPSLNEGLRSLHLTGMLHKDVKPAHLFFLDNWSGVALIDCANNGSNPAYYTLARTPEYAAPETFQQLFLPESDYYAFGITLFELCCGYLPYQNLSREDLAQFKNIALLPFPDTVSAELKQLIIGLTYWDISNQQDKTNPNRRWTYEEVKNWCMGKSQITPGETVVAPAYTFMNKQYRELPDLIEAMAQNWEEGKTELYSGAIANYFQVAFPDYTSLAVEAKKESRYTNSSTNGIYWHFLYEVHPGLLGFYWKDKVFASLVDIGSEIMKSLRKGDLSKSTLWEEILEEQLLSQYLQMSELDYQYLVDGVTALEISHSMSTGSKRNQLFHYYTMAYLLSGELVFCIEENAFDSPEQLYEYMVQLVQESFLKFETFCHTLIDEQDVLDVQLESWLISLGNDVIVDNWKESLDTYD